MRRQLALVAVATTSLVVLALLIPLARAVSTIPRDRATSQARLTAQSLAQAISVVRDRTRVVRLVEQTGDLNDLAVSVELADGTTLGAPFTPSVAFAEARRGAARTANIDGGVEVLAPTATASGIAVVRITVPDSELRRGVRDAWTVLAALGVILIVLAVAVADRLARSIVTPILALAGAARALEQGDLDARVVPTGPREVQEVGENLNQLADRIGGLLVSEREAVADLSHRLRTPITALRLDAEGLSDPAEARRVVADVDELTRAVDDLIRTARAPTLRRAGSCDLVSLLRERVSFWAALADEQGRSVDVDIPDFVARVRVPADVLGAAIDVLVENVFSHTEEGTRFSVAARVVRERAIVTIDDAGPGLRRRSTERGTSDSGSTGLGLSIARSTAESAGGRLRLGASPLGGLRVGLELPVVSRG